ncbi:ImmA/IrrE family metallo-endopeptidase [Bifidobacterium pseudolongum]|uniref:ImmA/IrrE family metallo-endopeptidase n=1 Tax=Bifidobacterium pseudolongum TaxID=1694 RepID=UPI001F0F00BC|nr:ImmA/IrrE family metallo-endopeptidase [Bifidobacterium pseudolongum]MCH4857039.1 ImmA/IrrE family metallo-endopeptidase [Bifidobacterium pseudolongum]
MLIETAERFCVLRERRLHGDVQGLYLRESNLILLDRDLTSEQRRCVLAHEISHARHLDEGCRMDRWSERRADHEAAMMLIDPLEYAYAEAVYEGNVMGMARELNVLPWVIGAYRERLHDDPHLVLQ